MSDTGKKNADMIQSPVTKKKGSFSGKNIFCQTLLFLPLFGLNKVFSDVLFFLGQILTFCQKLKKPGQLYFLVKNRNFGQKSKFWSKIEILAKNRNFGQK